MKLDIWANIRQSTKLKKRSLLHISMLVLIKPLFLWLIVVCVQHGRHGCSDDAAGMRFLFFCDQSPSAPIIESRNWLPAVASPVVKKTFISTMRILSEARCQTWQEWLNVNCELPNVNHALLNVYHELPDGHFRLPLSLMLTGCSLLLPRMSTWMNHLVVSVNIRLAHPVRS